MENSTLQKNTGKFVFDSESPKVLRISKNIIISTVTNKKTLWSFLQVPWRVYGKDKFWVPPLWKKTRDFLKKDNPYWTHSESQLFVAYKDNMAVGRIAAFIDYNLPKLEGEKVGYFGLFECQADFKIASVLLKEAENWLASKGINVMHGPVNGRIDLGSGFLLDGFGSIPYLLGSYSPKYYIDFANDYGLKKSRDLVSYHIDLTKPIPSLVKESAERCKASGVKIRPLNRFQFRKELQIWFDMLLEVFADHYGYTPASYEEMMMTFGIKELRWAMNPKLFLFAESEGQPIGFRWSLPDYNTVFKKLNGKLGIAGILKFLWYARNIERGRFIIMGIKKKYRGQGIGTCMNYHTLIEMKKQGYTCAEYGWIDESNIASRKAGEKMGGKLYKTYRVYEKDI